MLTNLKLLKNSKGETLIELLVSFFILALTLTIIISVFMTGRSGIVESWERTEKDECAVSIMEQLQSLPYDTLTTWENHFATGTGAKNISITDNFVTDKFSQHFANSYEIQFDLLAYKSYPITTIMQVNVRVRIDENDQWLEKASLIRKGESP